MYQYDSFMYYYSNELCYNYHVRILFFASHAVSQHVFDHKLSEYIAFI